MVTIREVAKAAGVSVATASRALNGLANVTLATREKIEQAAALLDYIPHSGARSLTRQRTDTIGVILPDLFGEFFSEIIRGIDQAAQASGYHLLVSSSHNERAEIEAALRTMRGRVDGLIVMSPDVDAAALVANLPDSTPVVLVNCAVRDAAFHEIDVDNAGGMRAMTRHLLAAGHHAT